MWHNNTLSLPSVSCHMLRARLYVSWGVCWIAMKYCGSTPLLCTFKLEVPWTYPWLLKVSKLLMVGSLMACLESEVMIYIDLVYIDLSIWCCNKWHSLNFSSQMHSNWPVRQKLAVRSPHSSVDWCAPYLEWGHDVDTCAHRNFILCLVGHNRAYVIIGNCM